MSAQSNVNVGDWKAKNETEFQCGAECCYGTCFNSGPNQAIDCFFGAAIGIGTLLGGIKLLIKLIDWLIKIGY